MKRVIQEYRSDIMDLVEYNSKQPVYKERYGFDPMEKTGWNKVPKVDKERAMKVYHENHGVPEMANTITQSCYTMPSILHRCVKVAYLMIKKGGHGPLSY